MNTRPTQGMSFERVTEQLKYGFAKLIQAQDQVASGKRIFKPSDDPSGTSLVLALKKRSGDINRWTASAESGQPLVDEASSAINDGVEAVSSARALVMQGLNGTYNAADRASIAEQVSSLRDRLLTLGNTQSNDVYIFGGSRSNVPPFQSNLVDGKQRVTYHGDDHARSIQVGPNALVETGLAGSQIFAKNEGTGATFAGLTGAASGATADQGTGFETLNVRHDATTGTLGSGLALVTSGSKDTFLADRNVVVDATAGTVRFGTGPVTLIPTVLSGGRGDVRIQDEHGAEIHLDFSGWDGTNFNGSMHGAGSMSLDGTNFTAIDFTSTNVELEHSATNAILHVDTTMMTRAGAELVTFSGSANVFDTLQGVIDDLRNTDGLDPAAVQQRLTKRLAELDRNRDNLTIGLAALGARSAQIGDAKSRLQDLDQEVQKLRSNVEDVDIATAVLDMNRTEQALQLAQQTGVKLLQNTLMNYMR
jgi:flagellar hook-associated protein 3 FlgL